jgi:hypothetical protein
LKKPIQSGRVKPDFNPEVCGSTCRPTRSEHSGIFKDCHTEARVRYEKALQLAKTVQPDFQEGWVPSLQKKLAIK